MILQLSELILSLRFMNRQKYLFIEKRFICSHDHETNISILTPRRKEINVWFSHNFSVTLYSYTHKILARVSTIERKVRWIYGHE